MKSFMEEYGKVIVVAIIIVALIGVALVFKTSGIESIKSVWKNFMTKSQLGLEISDSETSGGGSSEEETVDLKNLTLAGYSSSHDDEIQYEEGMTWGEWINSEYNTHSYTLPFVNPNDFGIQKIESDELIVSSKVYYRYGDGIVKELERQPFPELIETK